MSIIARRSNENKKLKAENQMLTDLLISERNKNFKLINEKEIVKLEKPKLKEKPWDFLFKFIDKNDDQLRDELAEKHYEKVLESITNFVNETEETHWAAHIEQRGFKAGWNKLKEILTERSKNETQTIT